jgi:hypothetical protein
VRFTMSADPTLTTLYFIFFIRFSRPLFWGVWFVRKSFAPRREWPTPRLHTTRFSDFYLPPKRGGINNFGIRISRAENKRKNPDLNDKSASLFCVLQPTCVRTHTHTHTDIHRYRAIHVFFRWFVPFLSSANFPFRSFACCFFFIVRLAFVCVCVRHIHSIQSIPAIDPTVGAR